MSLSQFTMIAMYSVLAAAPFVACVDASPGEFVEPSRDAGLLDGMLSDAPPDSACADCILPAGAPCRADVEQCLTDARCQLVLECMLNIGCFVHADFGARVTCAQPCMDEIGLVTADDPVVELILPVNLCTFGACRSVCVVEP